MRPGKPLTKRRGRSEEDFERWVAHLTERLDPFMAWLGVVFALVVGYELAVDLSPSASLVLTVAGWLIWSLFIVEFLAEWWLAPHRGRFLRRSWARVIMLAVPTLRVLSFLRLLRLGRAFPVARVLSSAYRTAGSARQVMRSRLGYVAALSVVAALAVAELSYVFERDHPRGVFPSFGDAVIWAFAAVLALQGDPVPASGGARLVMLLGFAFGLVIVASLAGTLGAFLVEGQRERNDPGRRPTGGAPETGPARE